MNTTTIIKRFGIENTEDYKRSGLTLALRLGNDDLRDFILQSNEVLMSRDTELAAAKHEMENWHLALEDSVLKEAIAVFITRAEAILQARKQRRIRRAEQQALDMFKVSARYHS